jgi:hypothetical protein
MVATSQYLRDLAFAADLLQNRASDLKPFMQRLTEVLKPIDPAALRLDVALETDFLQGKQTLKNPTVADKLAPGSIYDQIGAKYFYKPNATINEIYRRYVQSAELSRRPPALLAAPEQKPAAASDAMGLWDMIDNPLGKNILQNVSKPSASYVLYLYDLDAYNRLLGLDAAILAAEVSIESVGDFVAKSDVRFYDPYTGKPMAWDAASRQLSFKPSNELTRRKPFNLENGRVVLRI